MKFYFKTLDPIDVRARAGNQLTEQSNTDLKRAGAIIERLEKQVSTVIGDEWTPLSTEQVEKLRVSLSKLPSNSSVQIMYQNALGKSFAQSLAIAFRAAQWNVNFLPGSGFEAGIEVGRGKNAKSLIEAMSEVIDPSMIIGRGLDEDTSFYFIGVGSKPNR